MIKLRKFVSPEFIFGPGSLETVGQYSKNFGARKALVVSDPGVVASGWAGRVCQILDGVKVAYELFSEVSPNPRVDEVMSGVDMYKTNGCDVIVSIGGGSPIDCAKGIGIASSNNKSVLDFEGVDNVEIPGPPLICIPTTAGASADVSQFAIINNVVQKVKIAIISKKVVPDVALIDPSTTTTMDPYLTACTGMDALSHAIEAFASSAHSPIFDLHALEAIRLIRSSLIGAINSPDNIQLRNKMMLGSLEAGLAFSNASLGAVHAMAHSLGGFLDLPHGECNSMLLEHVISFNYDEIPERYEKIGQALGLSMKKMIPKDRKKIILDRIREFKNATGITNTLGARGLQKSDIPELSKKAMNDPCMITNPRRPTLKDIEAIYEKAL